MEKSKKLSHTAYGGINGEEYIPFIPTNVAMPEVTVASIVLGIIFAVIFAAANTYLGLQVGLTIAAGIPAAILGTGMLKTIARRNNILEANMVQSIAAMGESIAGGIIFTLPAVILWGLELKLSTIVICTLLGGLLGILFVVPFRKYLIVQEHGVLIFPEGMATSEILVNASEGGAGFKTVLTGLASGGVYKLLSGGFALWGESAEWTIRGMQNTIFGFNAVASLAGVGFIVGIEVSMYMFGGALLAWLGIIPLIKYVGAGLTTPLFPSSVPIAEMDAWAIWSNYVRYIGAGAVAAGGFISLGKSAPTIFKSFKEALSGVGGTEGGSAEKRTDVDVPMSWVIGGAVLVFLLSWLLPIVKIGIVGSIMAIIFSFFFAVVSARMAGIIGVSNNPVSGMTIATLLFVTSVLKMIGYEGNNGMIVAILAGAIVCIAVAVAGGAAQSLKTTYIIGGTPRKVSIAMYVGLAVAAVGAGAVVLMLDKTYGMGSTQVPAPQATLMSMVVKGVMTGELPWALVLIGVVIGIFCELARLPILPIALGLYLPIHLSASILFGGIIRTLVEKKFKKDKEKSKNQIEKGILLSSGLVAGDALTGIIIAVFAIAKLDVAIGPKVFPAIAGNPATAAVMFLVLGIFMYIYSSREDRA